MQAMDAEQMADVDAAGSSHDEDVLDVGEPMYEQIGEPLPQTAHGGDNGHASAEMEGEPDELQQPMITPKGVLVYRAGRNSDNAPLATYANYRDAEHSRRKPSASICRPSENLWGPADWLPSLQRKTNVLLVESKRQPGYWYKFRACAPDKLKYGSRSGVGDRFRCLRCSRVKQQDYARAGLDYEPGRGPTVTVRNDYVYGFVDSNHTVFCQPAPRCEMDEQKLRRAMIDDAATGMHPKEVVIRHWDAIETLEHIDPHKLADSVSASLWIHYKEAIGEPIPPSRRNLAKYGGSGKLWGQKEPVAEKADGKHWLLDGAARADHTFAASSSREDASAENEADVIDDDGRSAQTGAPVVVLDAAGNYEGIIIGQAQGAALAAQQGAAQAHGRGDAAAQGADGGGQLGYQSAAYVQSSTGGRYTTHATTEDAIQIHVTQEGPSAGAHIAHGYAPIAPSPSKLPTYIYAPVANASGAKLVFGPATRRGVNSYAKGSSLLRHAGSQTEDNRYCGLSAASNRIGFIARPTPADADVIGAGSSAYRDGQPTPALRAKGNPVWDQVRMALSDYYCEASRYRRMRNLDRYRNKTLITVQPETASKKNQYADLSWSSLHAEALQLKTLAKYVGRYAQSVRALFDEQQAPPAAAAPCSSDAAAGGPRRARKRKSGRSRMDEVKAKLAEIRSEEQAALK